MKPFRTFLIAFLPKRVVVWKIQRFSKFYPTHLYVFIHYERSKHHKSISKPISEKKITRIDFFKQYLVLSFWLCTGDRPPLIFLIFRLFWWILVIFAHSFESGYQQKLNIEKNSMEPTRGNIHLSKMGSFMISSCLLLSQWIKT